MRNTVRAIVLALVATGVVACEADERPGPAPGVAGNEINATPREHVRDGGQLVWPVSRLPASYNYHHPDGADPGYQQILAALMPGTFRLDAGGSPYPINSYVDKAEVRGEPDQVVTYRLNAKARWSDGTPITWRDFQAQWRALRGADRAFQVASSAGYQDIAAVARGADDREVVVTFGRRYADWPALFNPLYPAAAYGDARTFNEGWRAGPLLTAGPFKVDRVDRGSLTLVRDDAWWGARAKLDRIVFKVLDPGAQLDAYLRGEIDLVDVGADANRYGRLKDLDGASLRRAGAATFRSLILNGTGEILSEVRVRQAVARGIDRAAIARAMLGPLGGDPQPLGNHILLRNQTGYTDNSAAIGLDPVRAGSELEQAGWLLSGDVRKKGSRELALRFVIPANVPTSKQEAELVREQLGRIGVRVGVEAVSAPAFFDDYVTPGNFDLTVFSWRGEAYPIGSSRALYASPRPDGTGQLDIKQNFARIGHSTIDNWYEEAARELDRRKALEIAGRIDRQLWEQVHSVPLYQRPELWACRSELANVGAFGFASRVYEDMGWSDSAR